MFAAREYEKNGRYPYHSKQEIKKKKSSRQKNVFPKERHTFRKVKDLCDTPNPGGQFFLATGQVCHDRLIYVATEVLVAPVVRADTCAGRRSCAHVARAW